MAPGSPRLRRPDGGRRSFLAVAAAGEDRRCPGGDPHEAGPSRCPREVGPASGPHEAGRATSGAGHGCPSVPLRVLLRGRSVTSLVLTMPSACIRMLHHV